MTLTCCWFCGDTGLCQRCRKVQVEREHDSVELHGLRAAMAAIEVVAVRARDPLTARMARDALEGRYPAGEKAA